MITAQRRVGSAGQAGETGWREGGEHGDEWGAWMLTVRVFRVHHSRNEEIVTSVAANAAPGLDQSLPKESDDRC